MTDLVEFLLARLREDEALARVIVDGDHWHGIHVDTATEVAVHIERHDPARVLREVEAKRQIVNYESDGHLRGLHIDAWGIWRDQLKLLALPYADHPDYQQEWRLSAPS